MPRSIKALRDLPFVDLVYRPRSFHIYIDETGNEDFAGRSLFAFAGVAGYGSELIRAKRSWEAMKAKAFGSPEAPLHASGEMMTPTQLSAISDYFEGSRLRRFAYVFAAPPLEFPGINALKCLVQVLGDELIRLIGDHLPKIPDDLRVVFESSERLTPKIMGTFPGLEFESEGQSRKVEYLFADKSQGLPWLEMADQIAHRAQRQHRAGLDGELMPEFQAVFPRERPPHVRLLLLRLGSVRYEGEGIAVNIREDNSVSFAFSGDKGLKRIEQFERWLAEQQASAKSAGSGG